VRAGQYFPRDPAALARTLAYLHALETAGKYTLMVWTTHCEIGTWGHNVHTDLRAAYNKWEGSRMGIVTKIGKGSNPWTEHYSALAAEVPDPADLATQLNRGLISRLSDSDLLFVAGEAGSHCVRATVEDLVANVPADRRDKIVLVTDCMSSVTGFETEYFDFLSRMAGHGLQTARANDVCAELLANR
jgi:nicotinamidase/pyrazinamidase